MPSVTHNMILGLGAYHTVNRGKLVGGEGILGRSRDLHNNNSFMFDPLANVAIRCNECQDLGEFTGGSHYTDALADDALAGTGLTVY